MLFYERLILEEGTMEKLKFKQIMSLTLTLFAIFFGAGNMVFPPAMGQLAGENYWQALIGFILTDAGIALLGIIAVVLVGNEITDLGNLISKKFSIFLSIVVYLLIGPLFALPRTGSVSYELAAKPYVPSEFMVGFFSGNSCVFRCYIFSECKTEQNCRYYRKISYTYLDSQHCSYFLFLPVYG